MAGDDTVGMKQKDQQDCPATQGFELWQERDGGLGFGG
jgi:hypothetical protein